MLKELFLQWLSRRQAPKTSKNEILHFPGAITHRLSTHKPPICIHWCILMLYIVFDNFHALLANPIRQDILRGGGRKSTFLCFFDLRIWISHDLWGFLLHSRPLHRRKPFIVVFTVFPSVSRDYINLNGKFELQLSVFSYVNIELLVTKPRSYIVYSSLNKF